MDDFLTFILGLLVGVFIARQAERKRLSKEETKKLWKNLLWIFGVLIILFIASIIWAAS